MVWSVLGAVILAADLLSLSTVATLLSFESEDVLILLSFIHTLLGIQEDIKHFHNSFHDFIVDPARYTNPGPMCALAINT